MIDIQDLNFWYPGREAASLEQVSLRIPAGEFVLLTGPTGCGKSTLLKCLNGIIPHLSGGTAQGTVRIGGGSVREMSTAELSAQVGLVQQSPDDQIFATVIQDEVAFGPENLCMSPAEINHRLDWALAAVDLAGFRLRSTTALSGGQKQRLAIAAMLALKPKILALDEPISQLDPQGAAEVMDVIKKLNKKYGVTVVMVEHRIHEVAQYVDRIVVMRGGKVVFDAPTREAMKKAELFADMGLRVPETVEIARRLRQNQVPMTVDETVGLLKHGSQKPCNPGTGCASGPTGDKPVLEIKDLFFRYGKGDKTVLNGIRLTVRQGERVAIMGRNGSGKSTLLAHMAAMTAPQQGAVLVAGTTITKKQKLPLGKVGLVMQNPDLMLFQNSVRREVEFGLKNLKIGGTQFTDYYRQSVQGMALNQLEEDPPLSLSRGQRLRTAIAAVVAMHPEIVFLDEPTTGQDKRNIDNLMAVLIGQVKTLVFCTHDVETAICYATRVIVLAGGKVVADAPPRTVFADAALLRSSGLKPTQSWLVGQELGLPNVFTPHELEERWLC
ncbi:ABC transporter ATP-binding protein [Methylomusa anaerophila]|uniref:Putative HMP/thiamine import ATP-binding protein YkoD n=1 Tax=Methylomusa anaerophila TaxID=1930071 RepID=A0A348AEC1_9FIRM|nr:energy-coupling factor transporter ATPase [Methylomusa anaerophila]BBB89419.1 putative HMP/thiamine import ATP-binding protein YkoD [Methylomusa anaerophila]